jgi:hypothetical protein
MSEIGAQSIKNARLSALNPRTGASTEDGRRLGQF